MYETSNQYADKVTARYTWTPEGKLLSIYIFRPVGGYWNYYYYHYNAHGDVVAVTDSNGDVYRQYAYDPYGNVISVKDKDGVSKDMSTDDFNHAYTYAGYRYDKETGLYFLNARYYNAGIGRFLTKDTFKGRANDPQSLNRYAYAHGNPVSFVDPTGHDVGAPGMDLGVYTEYQKQGLYPTGSYDTPMPAPKNTSGNVHNANSVANANDQLLSTTALTIDGMSSAKSLLLVANKGLSKAIGKSLPVFGASTLAYGLAQDWINYNGNNLIYAMGLTFIGATLPVIGTAFLVGVLGATTAGITFGVTSGFALSFIIPEIKSRRLKKA